MASDGGQKKRSSCEKFMQMVKTILKLSSLPLSKNNGGSSSSPSTPHRNHPVMKQPKKQTPERAKNIHVGGSHGRGTSAFINIQEIDQHDMQTSELADSVTNLMVSDYIKRFHERNMRNYYIDDFSTTTTTNVAAATTTLPSK